MATPARLIEFRCPECECTHWTMDSDYRGMGAPEPSFEERTYTCPSCGYSGPGFRVVVASPPEFILQPHPVYPMTQEDFDYWAGILRRCFPDDPHVAELDTSFVPYLPERAAEDRRRFEEQHPVALMRDQDGARRRDPSLTDAEEWLDMMSSGDVLEFHDRTGGRLVVRLRPDSCYQIGRAAGDDDVAWKDRARSRDEVLRTIRETFVPSPPRRWRGWSRGFS